MAPAARDRGGRVHPASVSDPAERQKVAARLAALEAAVGSLRSAAQAPVRPQDEREVTADTIARLRALEVTVAAKGRPA